MACFVSSGSFEAFYTIDLFLGCFSSWTIAWVMTEQALQYIRGIRGGLDGLIREELDMYGR